MPQAGKSHKLLKTVSIIAGCLVGLPLIIVLCILVALTVPSIQQKAVQAAMRILSDKTGIEASIGHFSIRPPFDVLLKDVYTGNEQGDTLIFIECLDARLRIDASLDSIAVKSLKVNDLVAHSAHLIPSIEIDGKIKYLSTGVKSFKLNEGCFRMTDARITDADINIELNSNENEDSPSDSTNLRFDLDDVILENFKLSLQPMDIKLIVGRAEANAVVDLEKSCYTSRNFDIADTDFSIGNLKIPVKRFAGDVFVDIGKSYIFSDKLSISTSEFETEADFQDTRLDLETMRLNTFAKGTVAGSEFSLNADYGIDDETFKADLCLNRTDLAKLLRMSGDELIVSGHIRASGTGINPTDRKMTAELVADMDSCRFNKIDVSGVNLSARLHSGLINGTISAPVHFSDSSITTGLRLDSRFSLTDFSGKFPGIDFDANLDSVDIRIPNDTLVISRANIDFKTQKKLCRARIELPDVTISTNIPVHIFNIPALIPSLSSGINTLAALDSLTEGIPEINVDLKIMQNNPLRSFILKRGFDLTELMASLHSTGKSRALDISLKTPDLDGKYRLPAINAALSANLSGNKADATLKLNSDIRDGLMYVKGIDSDIDLNTILSRNGDSLNINGNLKLSELVYDGKNIGDKKIIFSLRPETANPDHFITEVVLDEIPVDLAKQFVTIPEGIDLQGKIKSRAIIKGLPDKISLFAGIKPVDVAVAYNPYNMLIRLSNEEITLKDDKVSLNRLSLIGADSTFVVLDGGLDLKNMSFDISAKSDNFEPVKLPEGGPVPVYGKLLAGIDGNITGPVDSLFANIDVSILPQTDITYPIDKKNLAQVSPSGTINLKYNARTGFSLGGQLDVTKGKLFYSPKLYPMMPFSIDKGSHIKFNGNIEDTELSISASQRTKAIYKPRDEVSRGVDFITGVKVAGTLKKMDIGFFLDAPQDKEIQKELFDTAEEDREGLAAVLLTTGMYASESNEAAQMEGYALTSIVQSKLNAATSNRLGGTVDLDFGVSKAKHEKGIETTDYTINVSKSFFKGKLNVKLGGSVSDNAEVNKNSASFINNLSAEYRLDSAGMYKTRLFSMKDYNNIVEGELIKSGTGILIDKTLKPQRDSLDRSLDLEVAGNLVLKSNNQLGPDVAVSLTKQNIFSQNDIFTAKLNGAYYWNLNRKQLKDPSRNDTYLFGADFSLRFPYMQFGDWARKYNGQTLYRLGYLNENISGNYSIHKLYGGIDYSIQRSKYISHSFSPIYLSIVLADNASEDLSQDIGFVELLKLFINNEFIPSTMYSFNYNNYRDRNRDVNTALDFQIKESGNIISGIQAANGKAFNERFKKFLGLEYDQFVKFKLEIRNKFKLSDKLELATRAMAGATISFGNSVSSPLSEAFSIGGPNSIRAFSPHLIGPGDFHDENYSSYIFHTGDMKMEMNAELRFPLVWKFNGALFVDAGNIWNQRNPKNYMSEEEIEAVIKGFNLTHMYDTYLKAETFLNQIALGTGMGLRLDYESIVIRLDLGVAIHAPYDTERQGYYNIPNFWRDGLRFNFGIGYPF